VIGSTLFSFLISIPALPGDGTFVPPVALIAVTSIGTIGLYIAYVAPVYLRWRAGESFEQGSWNLGNKWRWMNPIAVVFVAVMLVVLCFPFFSTGVPWESDFDWNAFNFTPLVVGIVFLGIWLAWVLGARTRYQGPIRTIEFEGEGMAIKDIDEPSQPAAPPPGAST
jgi:hypothetical protein